MGAITCLGNTRERIADSLRSGRSGIDYLAERKELGFRSALGGKLEDPGRPAIPKRNLRQMGQAGEMAVHASQQALDDAGLKPEDLKNDRTAVIVGCGGIFQDIYRQCHQFRDEGLKLGGTSLQRVMADSVSANLTVLYGTRGYSYSVSAACATGALAIGNAFQLLRWGIQDLALCGGVHEDSWEYFCQFDALKAFSMREDEPTRASRPFDKDRDGLVPSAGGSILILEDLERARARGAKVYAELIGYAFTSDGHDMTVPSGEGNVRCMRNALEDAGITAGDVTYINAHATSTPLGDKVEAQGIAEVFGTNSYVSSTKSMTGHEQGAAGSNETVYTALMIEHGFIAPTINLDEVDPDCAGIKIVGNEALEQPIEIAASNSFGFGGVNTCLLLKKPSE
jgi:3-oxoacyl-[acyl-carrier-protein] synthase-1